MELNIKTNVSEVLTSEYQSGRAVELPSAYIHASVLREMRAWLTDRLKVFSGPLYMGEAEHLLLNPLLQALRASTSKLDDGKSSVVERAYQIAAAYSLIFDITKISQSKEIAREITLQTLSQQPIYKLLSARAQKFNIGDSQNANGAKTGGGSSSTSESNKIWGTIQTILKEGITYDFLPQDNRTTPLALVAESASFSKESVDDANVVNVWNTFLAYLKHGKGVPLDRDGRKVVMQIHTEILARIDFLIAQAGKTTTVEGKDGQGNSVSIQVTASPAFAEAFTAMYWYRIYLDAFDQYDVVFPSAELMTQSQAWVLSIKTAAAKFKKMFMDVAQMALGFDIHTAMIIWKEVYRFYDPAFNHSLADVSDLNAKWAELEALTQKMLSPFACQASSSAFKEIKQYMDADYTLPNTDFRKASILLAEAEKSLPKETKGVFKTVNGLELLTMTDTVGELPIGITDRDMFIPELADKASNIELALKMLKRMREVLQLSDDTDDIYHALLPEGVNWIQVYELQGSIKDLRLADFNRHDPLQLAYEKYDITATTGESASITSADWKLAQLMMVPFYKIPQMLKFTADRSQESRVIWPGMLQVPVSDVISTGYIAQPLPACYTASRNAKFVSNDINSYLTLMTGHSGVTLATRDYFRKIAAVMDRFPDTYAKTIIDALAGVMFVYKATPKSSEFTLQRPSVPVIYGAPLSWMEENNKEDLGSKISDGVLRRRQVITTDAGNKYAFVLHKNLPSQGPVQFMAYAVAKGVYIHIPVLQDVWKANEKAILDALEISMKGSTGTMLPSGDGLQALATIMRETKSFGGIKARPVLGWAPYLINLPHMMWDHQPSTDMVSSEDYQKYSLLSVRVRYDNVDRTIFVAGFIDNPVELLDISDYERAHAEEDPAPNLSGSIIKPEETNPETGSEKPRAEAEAKPNPATIGAGVQKTAEETKEDLSKVTQSVVLIEEKGKDGKKVTKLVNPAAPTGHDNVDTTGDLANAAKGDPNPAQPERQDASQDQKDQEGKYWKKIGPDNKIVDVVKAIACPDGYVPASEDEYREFVLSGKSERADESGETKDA